MLGLSMMLAGCQHLISKPEPQPAVFSDSQLAQLQPLFDEYFQKHIEANQQLQQEQQKQLTALATSLKQLKQRPAQPAETAQQQHNSDHSIVSNKVIVGAREWVLLMPPGLAIQARIDTGAKTSSLSADNIEEFERDGKPWVRFKLSHEAIKTDTTIEAPLVRHVRIRQANSENSERRAVIELSVQLGPIQQKTRFTLADRSGMTYPALLGRELLQDTAVVDVSKSFSYHKPSVPLATTPLEPTP